MLIRLATSIVGGVLAALLALHMWSYKLPFWSALASVSFSLGLGVLSLWGFTGLREFLIARVPVDVTTYRPELSLIHRAYDIGSKTFLFALLLLLLASPVMFRIRTRDVA